VARLYRVARLRETRTRVRRRKGNRITRGTGKCPCLVQSRDLTTKRFKSHEKRASCIMRTVMRSVTHPVCIMRPASPTGSHVTARLPARGLRLGPDSEPAPCSFSRPGAGTAARHELFQGGCARSPHYAQCRDRDGDRPMGDSETPPPGPPLSDSATGLVGPPANRPPVTVLAAAWPRPRLSRQPDSEARPGGSESLELSLAGR
jgi:hypothetical protein